MKRRTQNHRDGRRTGVLLFFFSSRRRHTRYWRDWSSDVCSSDLVFFYASVARPYEALLAGAAMAFSLLTSYARARAEGLNIECQVGLLERAGRVVILSAFSMAGMLTFGLYLVAAGALITTAQRILHVRRATRE